MRGNGVFSSKSDNWRTPSKLYDSFMKKDFIDCFPFRCNLKEFNQFDVLYVNNQKLFVNPPYSLMNNVVFWLYDQINYGCKVALLVPARTDTKWFHFLINNFAPYICFIKGRLKFNDSLGAPFPSLLLLFNFEYLDFSYNTFDYESLLDFIDKAL